MGVFHLRWAFVLGAGAINGEEKKWVVKTPPVAPKPPISLAGPPRRDMSPCENTTEKLADDDLMLCTGGLIEFPKLFDSL